MSLSHPTPWNVFPYGEEKVRPLLAHGKRRKTEIRRFFAVVDSFGRFIADLVDEDTAREIAAAVNAASRKGALP